MKNRFEVNGEITTIFLKRKSGEIIKTIIDTDDLRLLQEYNVSWYASFDKHTKGYYVNGSTKQPNNKYAVIRLHSLLCGFPAGKKIDHKNHNTLDNRRSNLQTVNNKLNQQNRMYDQKRNKSGIRNVHWDKQKSKWVVRIGFDYKKIYVGSYDDIAKAEKAAIEARVKYMSNCQENIAL